MISSREQQLEQLLEAALEYIDIPDDLRELAVRRYELLGRWLSLRARRRGLLVDVYPQGSFRLGTVVRPISGGDQYDIDMVYLRHTGRDSISQATLKTDLGNDLEAYVESRPNGNPSLKEGKRCWTLIFRDQPFHMDVLPAIPDSTDGGNSILLPDRGLMIWQHSNPIDYSKWFRTRMAFEFLQKRRELAAAKAASVDDVPEWKVKTKLQRAVQALKRHRDIFFVNRPDDRPASIIITTLAAHSYAGGETLYEVLASMTKTMPGLVELRNGVWWVANPVQADENFADRWRRHPDQAQAFFDWINRAQDDFRGITAVPGVNRVLEKATICFGEGAIRAAAAAVGIPLGIAGQAGQLGLGSKDGHVSTTPVKRAPTHTFHGDNEAPRYIA